MGASLSIFAAGVPASASKKSTRSVVGAKSTEKETEKAKASDKPTKTEKETVKRREYTKIWPDQCGLEKDGEWFEHDPEPRIITSQATPKQAAMYQRLIDTILAPETIYGQRVDFHPNDVVAVMIEVQPYLASEPVLIEDVPFGINIVGDLHGQLYDLDRIFKAFAKGDKPGYLCSKFLFLGNYVDRGLQQLEVIMLLFCLKMLYPDNFILLRGNHEFVKINVECGFGKECYERYCEETYRKIFAQCNETFMYLSLAAIVGIPKHSYLCVHAGISPRQFNREELRNIGKPILHATDDFLIHDMVWSDPAVGLEGTVFNYNRGRSIYFGGAALVRALYDMDCIALFRGHMAMEHGFENLWDICFSVYSATGKKNDGAVVRIDEKGRMSHAYILIKCDKRNELMEKFLGGDGPKENNDGGGQGKSLMMGPQ